MRIARRLSDDNIGKSFNEYSRPAVLANPEDVKSDYYFSIITPDQQGQILRLAEIFNQENASFKQILQQKSNGKEAQVVIVTHRLSKTQLAAITEKLESDVDFKLLNSFKVLGK